MSWLRQLSSRCRFVWSLLITNNKFELDAAKPSFVYLFVWWKSLLFLLTLILTILNNHYKYVFLESLYWLSKDIRRGLFRLFSLDLMLLSQYRKMVFAVISEFYGVFDRCKWNKILKTGDEHVPLAHLSTRMSVCNYPRSKSYLS